MSIVNITTNITGLVGVTPALIFIQTNDTNATVTAAGYLTHLVEQGYSFNSLQYASVYTTDLGVNWYQVNVVDGIVSLVAAVAPGAVVLPTVANYIAKFTNAGGTIGDAVGVAINQGNIQAGIAGTQGSFIAFGAANHGVTDILTLSYLSSGANRGLTITNAAMGQATTMTLPDPGNAAGRYLVGATAAPFVANHSLVANGTAGVIADAGYQMKTVAQAAVAGGAAAQVVIDAFCTAASMVTASWNDTTNPTAILTVTADVGQFTVTCALDPGASHLNYIITKV